MTYLYGKFEKVRKEQRTKLVLQPSHDINILVYFLLRKHF